MLYFQIHFLNEEIKTEKDEKNSLNKKLDDAQEQLYLTQVNK